MNLLKTDQLSVSNPIGFIDPVFLNKNTFLISAKMMNLSKSDGQLAIKLLSGRLNIRPYNKLSKEAEDFKDLCDEHMYT